MFKAFCRFPGNLCARVTLRGLRRVICPIPQEVGGVHGGLTNLSEGLRGKLCSKSISIPLALFLLAGPGLLPVYAGYK